MTPKLPLSAWGRHKPGTFLAVPLPSRGFGYARLLNKLTAFYDYKSEEIAPIEEVVKHSVAFIISVHVSFLRKKLWPIIGYLPLESSLQKEVSFFRYDQFSYEKNFLIYVSIPHPINAYREYVASPEECVGLEAQGTWEPSSVEKRLEQHFLGETNDEVSRADAQLYEAIKNKH